MSINRRQLIYLLGTTFSLATLSNLSNVVAKAEVSGPFELPPLPYDYKALEPYIDAKTMQFHHDKHHAGYTRNLNIAVNKYPELLAQSAEDLLRNINQIPTDIKTTVRNNGGGYVNHQMFWEIMSSNGGGEATGDIAEAINNNFGSFATFQQEFNKAGSSHFGSGWVWLVLERDRRLKVISTPNQDSPLMDNRYPIMGNDLWEHAYYLNYKNNRGEYLAQWWNVVNWDEINNRYRQAIAT